ncbi:MAG TPA: serine/threonine-protein kinase [Gemmatimonadales bacterium]|nr:serine/threonine-protein kinase [Gemmatimonadales bacterium]
MARDLVALVNTTLAGKYVAEREVGKGATARIYQARDAGGRTVALKVLRPELLVSVEADRFVREIQLASQLGHRNIARLLDSGSVEWVVYYAMELVEGQTLRERLDAGPPLTESEVASIAADLLAALAHAHEKGVVHRDVKPENVVLSPQRGAVLLDFGIARAMQESGGAKLTGTGIAVGTCQYMSPEQIMATAELDGRTDLYSLGCLLYESLTGAPPFVHPSDSVVMQRQVMEAPPELASRRPDLDPALAACVMRALAKRPSDRWTSAAEMRQALAAAARSTV